jgi:multidrug efflux pump subunit AcrA (membrane-fusion protein)
MKLMSVLTLKRLVLVAVVIGAGWVAFRVTRTKTADSQRIGNVKREDLVQRVTIAGTAEAVRTTVITAPYDGYIKKIYVKLGQKVKEGEPIISVAQSLQTPEQVYPIRAPFGGTVTQIMKTEGQFAKQNDLKDFVVRLDDMQRMYINGSAPEIDIAKIHTGMEAVIKVSAILSRSYKGIVKDISLAATPKEQWGSRAQVEYLVKIQILDADESLKPGMTAVVDIVTNKRDGVLTLAHEFLGKEGESHFVVLKDGKKKKVEVGLQNETAFEILKGLVEKQEVLQIDFVETSQRL